MYDVYDGFQIITSPVLDAKTLMHVIRRLVLIHLLRCCET